MSYCLGYGPSRVGANWLICIAREHISCILLAHAHYGAATGAPTGPKNFLMGFLGVLNCFVYSSLLKNKPILEFKVHQLIILIETGPRTILKKHIITKKSLTFITYNSANIHPKNTYNILLESLLQ